MISSTFLAVAVLSLFQACFSLSMTSSTRPFALNAKVVLRDDTREKFLSVILDDQAKTLSTEPGALQFVVGEDVDTPNTFYLHEQYVSKEAFDDHCKTPHFAVWEEFCKTHHLRKVVNHLRFFFNGEHEPTKVAVRSAFCVDVNLYVKPEVREEFLTVIRNNKKGSDENEPLCFQYVYGESTDTPNTFHFHEEYDGKEGFDAHAAAPHFAAWEEFAGTDPFTKPPVVQFYKTC